MKLKENFKYTQYACFIGYITQAIVNNFVPLLFLTFQRTYDIPLEQITLLISGNFGVQLVTDIIASKYADRVGYRRMILIAHLFAATGIISLTFFPAIMPTPFIGLFSAVTLYAIGGGIIEVLISPIVEACPTENKDQVMSLLHSFYCWGHVGVILLSTLFFFTFGIEQWRILTFLWALIPIGNFFFFTQVPIRKLVEDASGLSGKRLLSLKLFWIFILLMICAGAAEQAMSQWASTFAESGLDISKTLGDLAGPCLFAVLMGTSRLLYGKFGEKISIIWFMLGSCLLCIAGYLIVSLTGSPIISLLGCSIIGLSVGILWPGAFSLSAFYIPKGGTLLFGLLAFAGDLGCSLGPAVVGATSRYFSGELKPAFLAAIIFPLLSICAIIYLQKVRTKLKTDH